MYGGQLETSMKNQESTTVRTSKDTQVYTHHTHTHTSLSLSLTHCSLASQFPSHPSVTRQLSPGLRTPHEIIPLPTLPLWFPWQRATEQWGCQVTEGRVIGDGVLGSECACLFRV